MGMHVDMRATRCLVRRPPQGPRSAGKPKVQGARLLANLSASPFHAGKSETRFAVAKARASEAGLPLLYVNGVGCEDGWEGMLVFDGGSFAVDRRGEVVAAAPPFEPRLLLLDLDLERGEAPAVDPPRLPPQEEVLRALVLGLRTYAARNGFSRAVLGLSGCGGSASNPDLAAGKQKFSTLCASCHTLDDAVAAGAPAGRIGPNLVLARYVGQGDVRRRAAEIAREARLDTLVSDNRALLADFFYTLRDSGLAIYAEPVAGFPPHHYAQSHPLPQGPGDVLFVNRDAEGPDCDGAVPALVASWRPELGFLTRDLYAFRVPRSCWFPSG